MNADRQTDAPLYELDPITLGQAELVRAPRLEVMHNEQDRAGLRVACSILRHVQVCPSALVARD